MPVVVDEIVVSVEVGGAAPAAPPAAGGGAGDAQRALVSECVERVLEILERKQEP